MNGFLVRSDGALIAIDHILYIQKEPLTDGEWNVIIYLTGNVSVQWNEGPLRERDTDNRLKLLRELLQEAVEY